MGVRSFGWLWWAVLLLAAPQAGFGQGNASNPFARDAAAIAAGRVLYLSDQTQCASCHGPDARGGDAPSLLTSRLVLGGSDERLFKLIREGVPGAGMPPQQIGDEAVWKVAAYLQSLARPGMQAPVAGDARRGERIFESAGCRSCHMIGGIGGFLGPDLSDAALRLTADEMRRAVVDPSADASDGFRAVTVVTSRGERVTGLLRNESNFSVQLQRRDGTYLFASRDDVSNIEFEPASLMPSDFSRRLGPEELQDLLAYLDQQRAPGRSAAVWLVKPH